MVYSEQTGKNTTTFYLKSDETGAVKPIAEVEMFATDSEEIRILVRRYEDDPTIVVTVI
jgi:hypothetical protein